MAEPTVQTRNNGASAVCRVIGLRLLRALRQDYGLAAAELPGDLRQIRQLVATVASVEQARGITTSVHAGHLHAAWAINAALSQVIDLYCEQVDSTAFVKALSRLDGSLGPAAVDRVLNAYAEAFDAGPFTTTAAREWAVKAVLLDWLANVNPGYAPLRYLVDDAPLRATPAYERVISELSVFFESMPPFGPDNQPLVLMLRSPALAVPDSLTGQLAYIRSRWSHLVRDLLAQLALGIDLLVEEELALWSRFHPAGRGRRGRDFSGWGLE